jgi:hypothetical protein
MASYDGVVNSTLAYIDQASFLGLRALGRHPVIQVVWIYRRAVDFDGLDHFRRNLAGGLLGRRVERSALPFGRHRWIAWEGPDGIDVADHAVSLDQVVFWADKQATLPIDPEVGPSWRLAVLPLTDGGAAVTLVVSHTVADGLGASRAITDAVNGLTTDLGYTPAHSRSKRKALFEDSRVMARSLPDIGRAVAAAVRLARRGGVIAPAPSAPPVSGGSRVVTVPSVTAQIDATRWDERALSLGGTGNSLLLGVAARLGRRLGWSPTHGPVTLSVPVNERTPDDTRGNALTAVTVVADPDVATTDLRSLRAQIKASLSTLGDVRDGLFAPLPLVPLTPRAVARKLEQTVVPGGVIGSSNLGELDPAVNRPDGTEADLFAVRMTEALTVADLQRAGGAFFPVVSGRVAGKVFLSVGYLNREATTARAQVFDAVRGALGDFGLSAFLY